jgi:hypothetical protein
MAVIGEDLLLQALQRKPAPTQEDVSFVRAALSEPCPGGVSSAFVNANRAGTFILFAKCSCSTTSAPAAADYTVILHCWIVNDQHLSVLASAICQSASSETKF